MHRRDAPRESILSGTNTVILSVESSNTCSLGVIDRRALIGKNDRSESSRLPETSLESVPYPRVRIQEGFSDKFPLVPVKLFPK